jgi:peptidyl-prolyl cis-trans isomerase SurA
MARGRGCWAAGLLAAAIVAMATASAQDVVVNNERIAAEDIDQRSRLDQLARHKAPSREQVIDELKNEALTLREARRRGIDIPDADVDQTYARMAARMDLTAEQLTQALAHQGVNARTLKEKIRADLARMRSHQGKDPGDLARMQSQEMFGTHSQDRHPR